MNVHDQHNDEHFHAQEFSQNCGTCKNQTARGLSVPQLSPPAQITDAPSRPSGINPGTGRPYLCETGCGEYATREWQDIHERARRFCSSAKCAPRRER